MKKSRRQTDRRTGLKSHDSHYSAKEVYRACHVDYSIEPDEDEISKDDEIVELGIDTEQDTLFTRTNTMGSSMGVDV